MTNQEEQFFNSEIQRLNKIIKVLIDRAEQGINSESSDFSLFQTTISLEEKVRARTKELQEALDHIAQTNHELDTSLKDLHQAQQQLIESKKMASLGRLVTGVAHELNTPIGICITGGSSLEEKTQNIRQALNANKVSKSQLLSYIDSVEKISSIFDYNLTKASALINNFKGVSSDIYSEEVLSIKLEDCFKAVVHKEISCQNIHNVEVVVTSDQVISLISYPNLIIQMFTILVANSLAHGYALKTEGKISVILSIEAERVKIVYQDDGCGMSEDTQKNIFEPFFTTDRIHGSSGLGMFTLYNVVTHKLAGEVSCWSKPDHGAIFTIYLPNLDRRIKKP